MARQQLWKCKNIHKSQVFEFQNNRPVIFWGQTQWKEVKSVFRNNLFGMFNCFNRQRQMSMRDIWREVCSSSMQAEQHQAELDKARIGPRCSLCDQFPASKFWLALRSVRRPKRTRKLLPSNKPKNTRKSISPVSPVELFELKQEKHSSSLDFCTCFTDWSSDSYFTSLFLCHQSRRPSQLDMKSKW